MPEFGIGELLSWGVSAVLVPAWLHTAMAIARNGRDVARLEGRVDAAEKLHASVDGEIRNIHQRVGGIARSTDRLCGQMPQIQGALKLIQEHLLQREKTS